MCFFAERAGGKIDEYYLFSALKAGKGGKAIHRMWKGERDQVAISGVGFFFVVRVCFF